MSNLPIGYAASPIDGVCGVCVTYHPDSNLAERLSKVLRQVSHLVVVDNGSSSSALRMLSDIAKDDRVTLVPCKENLGSAQGLNIGIEHASKHSYEFALLLDQDTRVNEDLVYVLTTIYRRHPQKDRLAIVGAGYAGSQQILVRTDDPDPECEEVETVIASGSLLPLLAFRQIGPFREEFFIDYVDSEYCERARRRGYLVVKSRQSVMEHVVGNPSLHRFLWMKKYSRNYSPDRLYYQVRNDTVMLRESGRYHGGSWRLKALNRAIRRCKRVIMFEHQKTAKVFGVLQGWCDGVRGRLGRRYSCR